MLTITLYAICLLIAVWAGLRAGESLINRRRKGTR